MLLQWTIVYRELVTQHRKKRTNAFADPLDGREWDGFGWIVSWFEKSAERRSKATEGAPGAARSTKLTTAASRSDAPGFGSSCSLRSLRSGPGPRIP
ncbi:hypothetical protein Sinme_5853 [Sinorhizobium meliloti AK83]|nr:hypothetical protein Sinme_5853 [Sinorhizobium meliloti AK83]SEJ70906.1 hypothetical protein SAMN04244575_05813 [Sinorhizobium meliloti]